MITLNLKNLSAAVMEFASAPLSSRMQAASDYPAAGFALAQSSLAATALPVPSILTAKLKSGEKGPWTGNRFGLNWLRLGRAKKRLQTLETVSLGEKRFIALVKVDDRQFLIGGAPSSVGLLTELAQDESFHQVLNEATQGMNISLSRAAADALKPISLAAGGDVSARNLEEAEPPADSIKVSAETLLVSRRIADTLSVPALGPLENTALAAHSRLARPSPATASPRSETPVKSPVRAQRKKTKASSSVEMQTTVPLLALAAEENQPKATQAAPVQQTSAATTLTESQTPAEPKLSAKRGASRQGVTASIPDLTGKQAQAKSGSEPGKQKGTEPSKRPRKHKPAEPLIAATLPEARSPGSWPGAAS